MGTSIPGMTIVRNPLLVIVDEAACRRRNGYRNWKLWRHELSTKTTAELIILLACKPQDIFNARHRLGITVKKPGYTWPAYMREQLGKVSDPVLASLSGVSRGRIGIVRRLLKIPAYRKTL